MNRSYVIIECTKCHRLSIHRAEKAYVCPYCDHHGRVSGLSKVYQSDSYADAYAKFIEMKYGNKIEVPENEAERV